MRTSFRTIIIILSLVCGLIGSAYAEDNIRISGVVVDSITGELLGFANVYDISHPKGVVCDEKGYFTIHIPSQGKTQLQAIYTGYSPGRVEVTPPVSGPVIIGLSPNAKDLAEVVVNRGRYKYSKNNPAVALMEEVRNNWKKQNPKDECYYSYDRYEKQLIGFNNYTPIQPTNKLTSAIQFLKENVDTSTVTGKPVLALSVKEKLSTRLYSQDPKADKEIIRGFRTSGIDDNLNQQTVRVFFDDISREIDIHDNDITLMQNRFISPLSSAAPDLYKFFIRDTVMIGNDRCVEIEFSPHNPATMTFNGKIYVPADDSIKYVRRISMRVPKAINLNFVKNLYVSQNFKKDSLGKVHKTIDDLTAEMRIVEGTQEVYLHRIVKNEKESYEQNKEYANYYTKIGNLFEIAGADARGKDFWDNQRLIPLSTAERNLSHTLEKLRQIPFFYWTEKIILIIANGYIATGEKSKFDFGPVNTFISANDTEGLRLRVGGMTTANLSPHLFGRGYVAYGFKDKRWKYGVELEYSFKPKKYHAREFPIHGFRATHIYDIDNLGQHYKFTNSDNIFTSLKRKKSHLTTYRRYSDLSYILELDNHFSVTASLRQEIQYSTPWLKFEKTDGTELKSNTQGYFNVTLRYAPNEKFAQGRTSRTMVNFDNVVFQLSHDYGPKKFLGSQFTLNRTEISVQKRFWLSAFGYIDAIARGGKIWSAVPYPELLWPNANLSYTIQKESYSLMNPMEFANDWFASLDVTYMMNGALFNLIPGFKKLKLREVITFKALEGGLTKRNNPAYNMDLYKFPSDASTHIMGKVPYMELGVGIDNILSILRVDYIWRLTYRHHPDIDRSGLRVSLHFSF